MVQVLKDEIREKIEKSAVDEFYEKGYKFATMKSIAQKSGIATSLIYSYFKNKEDLFKKVVSPVMIILEAIFKSENKGNVENFVEFELSHIVYSLEKYNKQFVILMDKSMGSSFTYIRGEIVDSVAIHLKEDSMLKDASYDDILYHILASNFVEGVLEISRHYVDKEWAENILNLLVKQFLYGISSLAQNLQSS